MRRVLLALLFVVAAGCLSARVGSDALHRVVANCLDTDDPRYCARCPDPQAGYCRLDYPCSRTTQVWALNQEYAAIRDIKMCGCEAGFVHGLALPRFTVTGVEDPRRPDGIWRFAWDVARLPDARPRVDALRPIKVERLEEVWPAATEHASSRRLESYGVILIRGLDGGWLVAAVGGSPEGSFTRSRCVP